MIVNHCGEVKGRRCGGTVNDSHIGKPVEFQNKRHDARKASVSRMPSTPKLRTHNAIHISYF